jgi:hypothetical protein
MSARWIDRPHLVSRRVLFLGVGAAVGIVIAVVDLLWRSRPYYELHRTEILSQVALFVAATTGASGAALLIPRWAAAHARHSLAAADRMGGRDRHGRDRRALRGSCAHTSRRRPKPRTDSSSSCRTPRASRSIAASLL